MNLFQKKVNEEIDDEIKEELAQEKIDASQENEFQFEFLECEKRHVFLLLMFVGGFYGAFTYSIRGGVFCNAQTANFVLFAMALGNGNIMKGLYYLVPMTAYLLGTIVSEALPSPIKKHHLIRWDTILIGIEIATVIVLGFIPDSAPFQITQIAINILCSMQYNTFRQARGIPMATTFCTNHVRQLGIHIVKAIKHPDNKMFSGRVWLHIGMLAVFVAGGALSAFLCLMFAGRAIWFALIPLGIIFFQLLYADLVKEKEVFDMTPKGH
ncbi:YoaK family protein [uncultured Dubosiella sp.]|jgi:uncharacterized membrane protein YoaK (UPF0700 family)|uniref:YoaK family protein n=1 Tax=uncultured Dubosiella sp. TaxID=1937011 RepID=UPI00207EE6EC|nr:YoaK family protein [uncultured Dubosiella sp.]GJM56772.1 DUF1275 family protein [Erysipelotrichaceae bacterium OPF54]